MLTRIGKMAAVIIIGCGALLTKASVAHADTLRPCTASEAENFCEWASVAAYQGNGGWWCPTGAACLYDDEYQEYAGSVSFSWQETSCETVTLPCL